MGGGFSTSPQLLGRLTLSKEEVLLLEVVFRKYFGFDNFKTFLQRECKGMNQYSSGEMVSLFRNLVQHLDPAEDKLEFEKSFDNLVDALIEHLRFLSILFNKTDSDIETEEATLALALFLLKKKKENMGILKNALKGYKTLI